MTEKEKKYERRDQGRETQQESELGGTGERRNNTEKGHYFCQGICTVAQTTNKAEPVGRCARQKGLKRKVKSLRGVRELELKVYCANQQDHSGGSVNIFWGQNQG